MVKKNRDSIYLLMINQQSCMAAKWVFQCAACTHKPKGVPEMEKNKALNFSEAKSGKMCVIPPDKRHWLDMSGKNLRSKLWKV